MKDTIRRRGTDGLWTFGRPYKRAFNRPRSKLPEKQERKFVSVPYVAGLPEKIGRCLRRFGMQTAFRPLRKVQNILPLPKDAIEQSSQRGVVYNIPCNDCLRSYVSQTKNALKTRLSQHRAALRLHQAEKSALAEHAIDTGHQIGWNAAKVVAKEEEATIFRSSALDDHASPAEPS